LGRPRVEVDQARLESVIRRGLSVRDGARELGISASSFARLVRCRLADDNGSTSQAAF
jgi:transposase-like protein